MYAPGRGDRNGRTGNSLNGSGTSTKRFPTFVTLRLGSRVFEGVALLGIGRGHQSARPSPIPSSIVERTPSVTALALRDVVVAFCRNGVLFHHVQQCHTTAASQIYVNRQKNRLVLPLQTAHCTSPTTNYELRATNSCQPPASIPPAPRADSDWPRTSGRGPGSRPVPGGSCR